MPRRKSIAEAEAVDLLLHASVVGLFDMDWLLVCPMCSDVVESFRSLRNHKPDALSACDYVFHFKLRPDGILLDGVPWSEAAKALVKVLTRIEPGSAANLELDATEGALFGQDFGSDAHFFYPVATGAGGTPPHVPVTLDRQPSNSS